VKRGRPKLRQKVRVIQVKLRLYEGFDDDLAAFFSTIPPRLRAAMVKQALRSGVAGKPATAEQNDELQNALDSLVS